jgi:two-component system chemotaxis sensor kinase CheA
VDKMLRQIVGVFADEVREQARKVAAALLAAEADPTQAVGHMEELYRQAHSLKGSSSSLGIEELETLAHQLEEALMPVRRGRGRLTPSVVDIALRAMDAARLRADGLVADSALGLVEVQASVAELEVLARIGPEIASADAVARETVGDAAVAEAATALPAADEPEVLRIAASRLQTIDRRLEELRAVRGRLDQRLSTTAILQQLLDRLWRQERAATGERSRATAETLYQLVQQIGALKRDLADDADLALANALDLDDDLRALRMVPANLLAEPLQRAVREACRRTEKEALFELAAGAVQLDRRLLAELKNPLLHLVRNAVDHGVESIVVREAIGKPSRARIVVAIEQRGRDVVIEVRDDGRGIDATAVRDKAVSLGILSEDEAARLPDAEVHELLFRPGFSTAAQVTELSGRGVGLDVVRDSVSRLHGRVCLRTELGRDTTFEITVPLTVATSETMLIEEGGRPFALPLGAIERIVRVQSSALRSVGGQTMFLLDDQPLPVVRLARVLGMAERHEGSTYRTLAVVRGPSARAAVVCERLLGSRDLVLRPLPPELQNLKLLETAAILPNGQAIFVLSARALVEAAHEQRAPAAPSARGPGEPGTILVADDSITTRSLLRNVLEASGFRVRIAADGEEALRVAMAEPIDVVVSDVRMPRLDGFALTARLRADPRTAQLPVVLFSSLESDEDRRRGSSSGANAYLTKSAFDRGQLLDVVTGLIRGS